MRGKDFPMQLVGEGRREGESVEDGGVRMTADVEVLIEGGRKTGQAHWISRIPRSRQRKRGQDMKARLFEFNRSYKEMRVDHIQSLLTGSRVTIHGVKSYSFHWIPKPIGSLRIHRVISAVTLCNEQIRPRLRKRRTAADVEALTSLE